MKNPYSGGRPGREGKPPSLWCGGVTVHGEGLWGAGGQGGHVCRWDSSSRGSEIFCLINFTVRPSEFAKTKKVHKHTGTVGSLKKPVLGTHSHNFSADLQSF